MESTRVLQSTYPIRLAVEETALRYFQGVVFPRVAVAANEHMSGPGASRKLIFFLCGLRVPSRSPRSKALAIGYVVKVDSFVCTHETAYR